jgi:hypothetical protein
LRTSSGPASTFEEAWSVDAEYRYELRRGDEVIATGHLSSEPPFEAGERITIGSRSGIVCSIESIPAGRLIGLYRRQRIQEGG